MSANKSTSRRRSRLSRAEIKAYEARRAEERRRLALQTNDEEVAARPDSTGYTMTRDDEFSVIKSDLVRLTWIVGILLAMLAGATVILS